MQILFGEKPNVDAPATRELGAVIIEGREETLPISDEDSATGSIAASDTETDAGLDAQRNDGSGGDASRAAGSGNERDVRRADGSEDGVDYRSDAGSDARRAAKRATAAGRDIDDSRPTNGEQPELRLTAGRPRHYHRQTKMVKN
jgi:hypothetical protein